MRRLKLVLGVAALLVAIMAASAAPASSQVFFTSDNDNDFCDHHDCDRDDFCDFFDINDEDCFDFDRDNDFLDVGDISQDLEQEADSGDIDQDFSVTSTGDNSNQCVGTQGVANTGNVQNAGSFDLLGGDFDDLEIDDSGASIDVDGSSDTSCDQEVNQAASASG
jgi:hypothetical protein